MLISRLLPQQQTARYLYPARIQRTISIFQPARCSSRYFASVAPVMTLVDAKSTAEVLADRLEKPELDNRSYRVIRLPNKLVALLVHDPDTDKASASVNVGVGSYSDDEDMPGMAHAVEHLLFMGTKKYPVENDYNQYLASHSGYSNAYTASTETNYYFEVAASSDSAESSTTKGAAETNGVAETNGEAKTNGEATTNGTASANVNGTALPETNGSTTQTVEVESNEPALYGALDRFAQFFIEPLFLEETLDRELQAVDSENKKNLQSDNWRLMQLDKSTCTKKHPYHHFSTGNLKTLRDDPRARGVEIRSEFIKFHDKHYSANRMKLVVLGKESLDTLQSWVEEFFSPVVNKNLPELTWTESGPYAKEDLLKIIFAKPVMESRNLDIAFTYQDEETRPLFESQPSRYITHLIGHEGPGSILAYIKAKGWANGLSAGIRAVSPGYALFHINVRMTPEGLSKYEEITKIIFQYIALIKSTPVQEWIFEELKNMSLVDFRFKEKSPATRFTSGTSSTMQKDLPAELLLSGEDTIRAYDPKAIEAGLSCFTPDNYRMQVTSQEGEFNQKEHWYGTEYRIEDISSEFQETLRKALSSKDIPKELHIPSKNEFVPTQLGVERKEVPEPVKTPKLIRNDDAVQIWWKKDDQFWVPKASFKVLLRNPLVSLTPENTIKASIYTSLVFDELNEYSYDAEISGLEWGLSESNRGLSVSIGGYNEKMPVLLDKVLTCMKTIKIKEDRFNIIRERTLRGYKNWEFAQPYQHSGSYIQSLRATVGFTNEEILAEIPHITAQDIAEFYPQLLKQAHIEVLAHGNLYKEDVLRMTQMVESIIKPRPIPRSQWSPKKRNLLLPEGSDYTWRRIHQDPANVNNAIDYFLYVGAINDPVLRAKLLLLGQIGAEPGFDNLRTKEQLGYIVFSGARYMSTTLGYRITIQSERSADYLENRINAFLVTLHKDIEKLTAKEFEAHKRSIINIRLEKLKNLDSEFGRFYSHISDEWYNFQQAEEDAEYLRQVTKEQILDFYNHYIHPSSERRAKLSVHIVAQSSPKEAAGNLSKEDQLEKVYGSLEKALTANGVGVDSQQLRARLADVDILGGDLDGIVVELVAYLKTDAQVPEQLVQPFEKQAPQLLGTLLPGLGIEIRKKDEKSLPPAPKVKATTWVKNVAEFKASLQMSAAATPVVDLSTFEELEPKL